MVERTPDKIIEISKQYLSLLIDNNIKYTKAYLFGSYIKGKANKYSDIDIAIFSEKWIPSKFEALQALMKLRRTIDLRVEPHPFDENDVEDSFAEEIIKTGKELIL